MPQDKPAAVPPAGKDITKVIEDITNQGDIVRSLKSAKADNNVIEDAVRVLLALKAEYKAIAGKVSVKMSYLKTHTHTHSWVGRGNPVLRHFVPALSPIFH